MQLKKEGEAAAEGSRPDPKKRHYALRRLKKASHWASELSRICSAVCDTRSTVEADAYSSWMGGNVLMEREGDWEGTLAAYTRARYEHSQGCGISGCSCVCRS
eukprot:GHUV01054566.1.p1 GENE.GHUV01054566.1~~GHUV01054566.1.p1  ORF type:complete len:103 (-),score=29.70 GHUV01054566.1:134-442(-)